MLNRYYIAVIPKIKGNLEREKEIELNDRNIRFEEIVQELKTKEIEIGNIDLAGIGTPFYKATRTFLIFKYYNPRIITKQDLKRVIHCVRMEIANKYYDLAENDLKIEEFIQKKILIWRNEKFAPYSLNGKDFLSSDKTAEYMIWDLVRLYQDMDWDKNIMVMYKY